MVKKIVWDYVDTETGIVLVSKAKRDVYLHEYGVYAVKVEDKYLVLYEVIDGKSVIAHTVTDLQYSPVYEPLEVTEFLRQEAGIFGVNFFGYVQD